MSYEMIQDERVTTQEAGFSSLAAYMLYVIRHTSESLEVNHD